MKTAVSLPDELFLSAEAVADRLGIARSKLFALALREFIQNHTQEGITERLNEIYSHEDSVLNQDISQMQNESILNGLSDETW